ncbi:hypothetical protein BH10PSE19_BH10PSE19_14820 [soil metagenome]
MTVIGILITGTTLLTINILGIIEIIMYDTIIMIASEDIAAAMGGLHDAAVIS